MEFLTIAYSLIAVVLAGYGFSIYRRSQTVDKNLALLQDKREE